jgi:hypothetical protein
MVAMLLCDGRIGAMSNEQPYGCDNPRTITLLKPSGCWLVASRLVSRSRACGGGSDLDLEAEAGGVQIQCDIDRSFVFAN